MKNDGVRKILQYCESLEKPATIDETEWGLAQDVVLSTLVLDEETFDDYQKRNFQTPLFTRLHDLPDRAKGIVNLAEQIVWSASQSLDDESLAQKMLHAWDRFANHLTKLVGDDTPDPPCSPAPATTTTTTK
jgi:hypothetical protein